MIRTNGANNNNYEAVKTFSKGKLLETSLNHIEDVKLGMNFVTNLIKISGNYHDWTKIQFIDEYYESNKIENIKDSKWYNKYHLKERHHLRDNPPQDVNFVDIIERMVNMCATASSSDKEFDWNKASIDPIILMDAYYNTLELIAEHMGLKDEITL